VSRDDCFDPPTKCCQLSQHRTDALSLRSSSCIITPTYSHHDDEKLKEVF
jgi:hypothetical protein